MERAHAAAVFRRVVMESECCRRSDPDRTTDRGCRRRRDSPWSSLYWVRVTLGKGCACTGKDRRGVSIPPRSGRSAETEESLTGRPRSGRGEGCAVLRSLVLRIVVVGLRGMLQDAWFYRREREWHARKSMGGSWKLGRNRIWSKASAGQSLKKYQALRQKVKL